MSEMKDHPLQGYEDLEPAEMLRRAERIFDAMKV